MRNKRSGAGKTLKSLSLLPAFLLSALLGLGFLGIVHKTHHLFSGSTYTAPQNPWHLAKVLAHRAVGS
ncbi:MAG TPA: hypothetical protein VGN86_08355 [Pyrinomonadaceae bacterium]|nr:hypothetical protein [Pyrinomonadaceae bacterium]